MAIWDATNASEITSGAIEVIIKQLEALEIPSGDTNHPGLALCVSKEEHRGDSKGREKWQNNKHFGKVYLNNRSN